MFEIYVMGTIIYGLAVVACSQKIIQKNAEEKAKRQKEEFEKHQLKMKYQKMQHEKDILEGNYKCDNVSLKDLL